MYTRPAEPKQPAGAGRAGRAWACALLLLAGTSTLAGWQAWQQSHRLLGPLVAPPGWAIAFRPPAQWSAETLPAGRDADDVRVYLGVTDQGDPVEFAVHRVHVGSTAFDADRWLRKQTQPGFPLASWLVLRPSSASEPASLGPFAGRELADPDAGAIARIAEVEPGDWYAIALSVRDQPLTPELHGLFEAACAAVARPDR